MLKWKQQAEQLLQSHFHTCEPTWLSGQVVRRRSRMQSEASVKTEDPGFDPPLGLILFSFLSLITIKTTSIFLLNKVKYLKVAWLFPFNWMEDL